MLIVDVLANISVAVGVRMAAKRAMVPPAPPRFSITTLAEDDVELLAMMRPMTSARPPGQFLTSRMGFTG